MLSLTIQRQLKSSLEYVIDAVSQALTATGFGIVSKLDLQPSGGFSRPPTRMIILCSFFPREKVSSCLTPRSRCELLQCSAAIRLLPGNVVSIELSSDNARLHPEQADRCLLEVATQIDWELSRDPVSMSVAA